MFLTLDRSSIIRKLRSLCGYFLNVEITENDFKSFFKHLSWSLLGGVIGVAILFGVNIIAGRILGPAEYGQYVLFYTYGLLLANFLLFGFDTALIQKTKNIDSNNPETKSNIGASFFSVGLNFLVLLMLTVFGQSIFQHTDYFSFVVLILLIGFTLALRNLSDAVFRAIHQFKMQAYVRFIEGSTVALIFLGGYFLFDLKSFQMYLYALIGSYALYTIFLLILVRPPFYFFNTQSYLILFKYARFSFVAGFAGFGLSYLDKIFVGHVLSAENLGLYNAYYVSSVTLVTQVSILFINILFPMLSKIGSKKYIFLQLHKFLQKVGLALWFLFFITTSVILLFFGEKYEWHFLDAAVFSLLAYLYLYFILIWWTIASEGDRGAKFTAFHGLFAVGGLMAVFFTIAFLHFSITNYQVALLQCVAMLYTIGISYKFYQTDEQ